MTTTEDQRRMFYAAQEKTAAENRAFMDAVNDPANPMTNDDLRKLVERHPDRYGRFAHFIGKLAN